MFTDNGSIAIARGAPRWRIISVLIVLAILTGVMGAMIPPADRANACYGMWWKRSSVGYIGSIAMSPNFSGDGTAFIGAQGGILKTIDSGSTWSLSIDTSSSPPMFDVAVSPGFVADKLVIAGGYVGAQESTDGGTSWRPVDPTLPSYMVEDMLFSPAFATDRTIFADTGMGLYKSVDRGDTWTKASTTFTNPVSALAVSPEFGTDGTLFAGQAGVVYRSTDGGSTWVATGSGVTGYLVNSIAVSPAYGTDRTLFVSSDKGVFKSVDGGGSWTRSTRAIGDDFMATQVVVSPKFAVDRTVFASGPYQGVFVSTDAGENWSAVGSFPAGTTVAVLALTSGYYWDRTVYAGTNTGFYSFTFAPSKNDVVGDGKSSAIAFYNYGGANTGAWVFVPKPTVANKTGITFVPSRWWLSGVGAFDIAKAKTGTGDFNGDGKTDALVFYDYGGTTSGLWLFKSTGNSYAAPVRVFVSPYWSWSKTKLVFGDFTGDGRDDVIVFYDYGGAKTGVWLFESTADGTFKNPKAIAFLDGWDWSKMSIMAVEEYGKAKIAVAYNYGGTTTGLWLLELDYGGGFKTLKQGFVSTTWNAAKTAWLAGDVNEDGKSEIIAFYNYGGETTGCFVFYQKPDGTISGPVNSFYHTAWSFAKSTFVSGDFDGNGKCDAAVVYDYGGGKTGVWVFQSDGSKLSFPEMTNLNTAWDNKAAKWVTD